MLDLRSILTYLLFPASKQQVDAILQDTRPITEAVESSVSPARRTASRLVVGQ